MGILLVLFLASLATATPLDDYVAKPDASYTYSLVRPSTVRWARFTSSI